MTDTPSTPYAGQQARPDVITVQIALPTPPPGYRPPNIYGKPEAIRELVAEGVLSLESALGVLISKALQCRTEGRSFTHDFDLDDVVATLCPDAVPADNTPEEN